MSLQDQPNSIKTNFNGRLAIQQRVLPEYRVTFFETLTERCIGGLSIFAGNPKPEEEIKPAINLENVNLVSCRNVNFLSVSSKFYLCWQIGLVKWLNDWHPDSLILEANPRYLSSNRAIRYMQARNLPVLGWGLGVPNFNNETNDWRTKLRTQFLHSLDALISYSQIGADSYKKLGIPAERIFVAKNAIMRSPISPPKKKPIDFKEPVKLLFVGRLQHRKRLDILINVCSKLPENIQPTLWIIGDGPARTEFREKARTIYPKAQFFRSLYGEELETYFQNADLFVLPGTGGLAVQQAMAFGLPVIMAEGDGTQSDLIFPENGWLVKTGDEYSLFDTLFEALSDRKRLRMMGMASYKIVQDFVNVDKMADVFIEALNYARNQARSKLDKHR